MKLCNLELSAANCNCWPIGHIYQRDNMLEFNETLRWCFLDELARRKVNGSDNEIGI